MGTDFGIGKLQQKGYGGAMLEKGEDFGLGLHRPSSSEKLGHTTWSNRLKLKCTT
jgi:hypothetical protein